MLEPASKSESSSSPRRPTLEDALAADLDEIAVRGLSRSLKRIDSRQGPAVELGGRRVLLFCSNNYLGLADHPQVVAAARRALEQFGASAVSSRLISGHMAVHADLEARIAEWKNQQAALVFSTGYQANVGTITALVGRGDVVVSDELNHASIIDGCRLSRAKIAIYRHNDVADMDRQLAQHSNARRALVVTESVFSMDGDRSPLAEIAGVAKNHGAWLMVDEAHAAGVFGPRGAGLVAEQGLTAEVDVQLGTLGKALGSFGAYVAGSRSLVELLVNRARPFVFTTALPPSAAAAALAALDIIEHEPERARSLLERSAALGRRLREAGLEVPHVDSQILPIVIGQAGSTVEITRRLLEQNVYVAAIRPPTVPDGTSRLRLSLMATHTQADIDRAAEALIAAAGQVEARAQ